MIKNKKNQKRLDKIDRKESSRLARENLRNLDKPRKPIAKSFTAKYDGDECPECFKRILAEQTVRFNSDDVLVHARHTRTEVEYEICTSCFLTKPCECE